MIRPAGAEASAATAWRFLPLLLLAAMLAIAVLSELLVHQRLLWVPKLPLTVLLLWPLLRGRRGRPT